MKRRPPRTLDRQPLTPQKARYGRALVAENLRRLRKDLGLSQEALADLSGLHRTYVGAVERAKRNVSIDNICRLAHAVGVEAGDLLVPPASVRSTR